MKSMPSEGRLAVPDQIYDRASYLSISFEASCTEKCDFLRKNRKGKYRDPISRLYPFVRVVESSGRSYRRAGNFVASVESQLAEDCKEREARLKQYLGAGRAKVLKTIDEFRSDARYGGDGTRVDLAYAIYAITHGLTVEQVDDAIRSRDLSHKGSDKR